MSAGINRSLTESLPTNPISLEPNSRLNSVVLMDGDSRHEAVHERLPDCVGNSPGRIHPENHDARVNHAREAR